MSIIDQSDQFSSIDISSIKPAVDKLARSSPIIQRQVVQHGYPPAWRRKPGYSSLVYTILEQQVSLASARAVYERLLVAIIDLTPDNFL
ncbi:MAG: DNA-3-methyladenine glycosylase 2 family protein, partial [Spirochaetales bacterium]|nr:DNA-3-methyladenine glycosylase 2 family protein [Spirochaetales bacterium]